VWDDDRRPGDEPWYDNQGLVVGSGIAALLLVGLLVYAVMRVSDSSVEPPNAVFPDTSAADTTSYTSSSSTTSYTTPSVQTSELGPAGPPPPPGDAPPPPDGPADQSDASTTPTTIYNPYAPPTSQGSAGHI
jgi:cytoskeletal protein RodZ